MGSRCVFSNAMLSRVLWLLGPSLVVLLFWPVLFGFDQLAFRDVGFFYTPLYQYVAERTATDWIPLWNPLDHTGVPLIGETTTAVLYPIRYVLFSLPISSHMAMGWYVALHLMLASVTARAAARWAGVGPLASTAAGIVYPLSGSVLFLYTNPPFLVGAAWLPLVVGSLLARSALPGRSRLLIAAVAMAVMILGGDPQTALHAVIVVGVIWSAQLLRRDRQRTGIIAIVGAPLLAAALAAPQLAASFDWARQSDRNLRSQSHDRFAPPMIGSQRHEAYQYSVSPWHAIELATPNPFGSLFPINSRWSRLIAGDGRVWTPSIYLGFVSLLAIAATVFSDRRHPFDRWFAVAVGCLLLSMGQFGLVWLIQAATPFFDHLDSSAGGPYWFLYEFLPGYDSFRYPAKWLPVFALAVAMLTAQVVDRGVEFRPAKILAAFVIASIGIVALSFIYLQPAEPESVSSCSDEFWGPLDLGRSLGQMVVSLSQTAFAITAVLSVIWTSNRFHWSERTRMLCLIAIVSIDLLLSGKNQIATVSIARQRELQKLIGTESMPRGTRWMRTRSGDGWPDEWKKTNSVDRIDEVNVSLRASRYGRWHLVDGISMLGSTVSIRSQRIAEFWNATRGATVNKSLAEQTGYWGAIRSWLAIDGVIHTTDSTKALRTEGRDSNVIDIHIRDATPPTDPVRLQHRWLCEDRWFDFSARLAEIVRAPYDQTPSLECDEIIVQPEGLDSGASIETLTSAPDAAEMIVASATPVLVTRPILQDGHWLAEAAALDDADPVRWKPTDVYPVDRITQGVVLPAGQWRLRFRYRPWWLAWSLGVAALGWIVAIWNLARMRPSVIGSVDQSDFETSGTPVRPTVADGPTPLPRPSG